VPGAKGVGESGCGGSLPALVNATIDALRPLGIQHLDMPSTPSKPWHALRDARQAKGFDGARRCHQNGLYWSRPDLADNVRYRAMLPALKNAHCTISDGRILL